MKCIDCQDWKRWTGVMGQTMGQCVRVERECDVFTMTTEDWAGCNDSLIRDLKKCVADYDKKHGIKPPEVQLTLF